MSLPGVLCWRLVRPRSLGPDAVDAALACDVATVSYGPHTFEFTKARTVLDDVRLRLNHRADCACERNAHVDGHRDPDGRMIERLIPAVTGDLDDATRAGVEAERLSTVGRALFVHVAHLIVLAEDDERERHTLRFAAMRGKYSRRTNVYRRGRICAAPGCGTLLSTYNPSLSCALHDAGSPLRDVCV